MKYGKELLLDLHYCKTRFNRRNIRMFFRQLCIEIDMQAERICWWDDHGVPKELRQTRDHTKGTTAAMKMYNKINIQFILTSNITIHTLDNLKSAYINIFSCKDFNAQDAMLFSEDYWKGKVVNFQTVDRL